MLDKFKDECGVFAIYGQPEAAQCTYYGLYALQHRGQESAGIAVANHGDIVCKKDMGEVSDVFKGVLSHMASAFFGSLYYKKQWRLSGVFHGWSRWKSQQRPRTKLRAFNPDEEDDAEPVAVAAPKMAAPMLDEHLEAKVDAVLEKMARNGKESLSENERQVLMRASEIYRRKRT